MRVADKDVVLEVEESVVVDGIWSSVEGFVEVERVDSGLAG